MPGIHHIELYVSDLPATFHFWGWLLPQLGFQPYQNWAQGRSWRCGDSYIVFVQAPTDGTDVPFHRRRVGLNHIALHADSWEQVDVITATLKQRNIRVLYEDRHPYAGGPEHYAVFFEDPDRIKVELVAAH